MLIRYPGSKDRAVGQILNRLNLSQRRLCEPFSGTAAVSLTAVHRGLVDEIWLNDKDPGIASLWTVVRDTPDDLIRLIRGYKPDVHDFYAMREEQANDPLRLAFTTIVLHQISYSGLGRKAGSPIGGRAQAGKYQVGCRWNSDLLCGNVSRIFRWMKRVRTTVTCGEWSDCPDDWPWYVDPPYFVAGSGLYRHGVIDHTALCAHLREKRSPWLLSYDGDPAVRDMYRWARIDGGYQYQTYLNHGKGSSRKDELLIASPRHQVPQLTLFDEPGEVTA